MSSKLATVLVISGHDPCGGAGIQADIETLSALNCIPVSVITLTSQQDTHKLYDYVCQTPENFKQQLLTLLNDVNINAIKIGAIGNIEIAKVIVEVLSSVTLVPIVIDPVLGAGGGGALSHTGYIDFLRDNLLPLATVITPNSVELEKLTNQNNEQKSVKALFAAGINNILVTGGHKCGDELEHTLYCHHFENRTSYFNKRLTGEFHGSGCTLAAAISAYLASALDLHISVSKALDYTHKTLEHAYRIGAGQMIPNRFASMRTVSNRMPVKGLYVISDDSMKDFEQIINKTIVYLQAGISVFQFRWKDKQDPARYKLAITLRALCSYFNTSFIVNDDLDLAQTINADGLHIGKNDVSLVEARETLPHAIIGVSCYDQLEQAIEAEQKGADYVAFGSFYPSRTKPEATAVPVDILARAREKLSIPIVAIGGITPENGVDLLKEGADLLAVISGLYQSSDDLRSVSRYLELF